MSWKVEVNGETVVSADEKLKEGCWYVVTLRYDGKDYEVKSEPLWKYKLKNFFSSIFRWRKQNERSNKRIIKAWRFYSSCC